MGDPAADFAALMSGAAAQAGPEQADAPYGYTRDRASGELRPKKVPGRPRARPPSVDELRAEAEADAAAGDKAPGSAPAEDRAPDEKGKHRKPEAAEPLEGTAYVPGRIAKGMNKLYRRAGKIVKAFDLAVGEALIEVTRKDDDEDLTVGDAWEELARVNPRIRRLLNRLITGGAWGQLAAAHMPIVLAVLMKPAILDRIPFGRLIEALADRDQDQEQPAEGGSATASPLESLQPADMQAIVELASRFAGGFQTRPATTPAHFTSRGAGLAPDKLAA